MEERMTMSDEELARWDENLSAEEIMDLHVPQIFRQSEKAGLCWPVTMCAMSGNGSALVARIAPDQAKLLLRHIEPWGFPCPVVFTLLDSAGRVMRQNITDVSEVEPVSLD
jgi:hypothetical protein